MSSELQRGSPFEPVKSPEAFSNQGIQALDITTAGSFQNPEEAWRIAERVNLDLGLTGNLRMGVEVYSTVRRPILTDIRRLAQVARIPVVKNFPVPGEVNPEKLWEWKKEYPTVEVVRVHPAFSYDMKELFHRILIGERENGIREQFHQIAWVMDFGAAINMRGVRLAEASREQGNNTVMNMHMNVLLGFDKDRRLGEVRSRVGEVLAENERAYRSTVVSDGRLIYDPEYIVQKVVNTNPNVDGLLLGVDHGYQHGIDAADVLKNPQIAEHLKALHIADTSKIAHGTIEIGNAEFARFFEMAAKTKFKHPVRAALDYSPMDFGKLPFDEKVKVVKETRDWILKMQSGDTNIQLPRWHFQHSMMDRHRRRQSRSAVDPV